MALSYGDVARADDLFRGALRALPELPTDDLWIRITAFIASPSSSSGRDFEQLLRDRRMFNVSSLLRLPLPAQTNFLAYSLNQRTSALALEMARQAGPQWARDRTDIEAWAFRLAILRVLARAKDYGRLATYFDTYSGILNSAQMEPMDRLPVELAMVLLMANALKSGGDDQGAARNFDRGVALLKLAIAWVDGKGEQSSGVAALGLVKGLAKCHLARGDESEAQKCYERCIEISAAADNSEELVDALGLLASLLSKRGKLEEATDLHRRRVDLLEHGARVGEARAAGARYQLANALLASGKKGEAAMLLKGVIQDLRGRGSPANQRWVTRARLALIESELGTRSEEALLEEVRDIFSYDQEALGSCRSFVKLAEQADECGRRQLGHKILATLSDCAPSQLKAEQAGGFLWGSSLALRFSDPALAETLAWRGLDAVGSLGGEAAEATRQKLSMRLVEARLQLTPAKCSHSIFDALVARESVALTPDVVCSLMIGAANDEAEESSHDSRETDDRYTAIASFMKDRAAELKHSAGWSGIISLLTHWLARKDFGEGVNTLEIALTLSADGLSEDAKSKIIERTCRLLALKDGSANPPDLVRVVRVVRAVGSLVGDPSSKLEAAIERFLRRDADKVLSSIIGAAKAAARDSGHESPETSDRYRGIASFMKDRADELKPSTGWSGVISLLTHWLARKDFGEGLNTLEIALTLSADGLSEDAKSKIIERTCRLLALEDGSANPPDLVRVARVVRAVGKLVGDSSSRLEAANEKSMRRNMALAEDEIDE